MVAGRVTFATCRHLPTIGNKPSRLVGERLILADAVNDVDAEVLRAEPLYKQIDQTLLAEVDRGGLSGRSRLDLRQH